jgi:hypothetical protein
MFQSPIKLFDRPFVPGIQCLGQDAFLKEFGNTGKGARGTFAIVAFDHKAPGLGNGIGNARQMAHHDADFAIIGFGFLCDKAQNSGVKAIIRRHPNHAFIDLWS